jgi:predicted molibdopterin-dependent oxidoreductase YjgC
MPDQVQLCIDGKSVSVQSGTLVAAAIAQSGVNNFRRSVGGEPRGPLCGMGVCMECRVTINGLAHCRSCYVVCEQGMEVRTDA